MARARWLGHVGRLLLVVAILALPASTFFARRESAEWQRDLEDGGTWRRRLAATALGRVEGDDVRPALAALLKVPLDTDPEVRAAVETSIRLLAPSAMRMVFAGAMLQGSHREPLRDLCVRALLANPDTAMPALAAVMMSPQAPGRERSPALLARFGLEAVPTITTLLRSANPTARALAATALGLIGSEAHEHQELLAAGVRDKSTPVRLCVMDAMARVAPESRQTLLAARELLLDPDPAVRRSALRALVGVALERLDAPDASDAPRGDASVQEAAAQDILSEAIDALRALSRER